MPGSQTERPESYFAHSPNSAGVWHRLKNHLQSVSTLAQQFAAGNDWAAEAALAGLLHDLGKYGDRFQARLQGKEKGLDHWSQGAQLALFQFGTVAAALAIEGHHIGLQPSTLSSLKRLLPERLKNQHPLRLRLSDENIQRLKERALADGIDPVQPASHALTSWERAVAAMLDVRMLFSCLVDADFLDTEAHFEGMIVANAIGHPAPSWTRDPPWMRCWPISSGFSPKVSPPAPSWKHANSC